MIDLMQEEISESDVAAPGAALCIDWKELAGNIKRWGKELGFPKVGIAGTDVSAASVHFAQWIAEGRHGEMNYMAKHAALRASPESLHPGTLSVVTVSLPYQPPAYASKRVLADGSLAYISRYALGRDYHKVLRQRLQKLSERILLEVGRLDPARSFASRAFADSAPVLEVEFARQAGIGWRGKHTLLLGRDGSWHFLGELFTNLPLPSDAEASSHCGRCRRCLDACPTGAIVAPYQVDARRCLSYLTIEFAGSIPLELRPLLGNRIYGCDDCQLCCPWNSYASIGDPSFAVRDGLDRVSLVELFLLSEAEFEMRFSGSPIRRIGYERWLRNIAVALGNGPVSLESMAALGSRIDFPDGLVREHVAWALARQTTDRPADPSVKFLANSLDFT